MGTTNKTVGSGQPDSRSKNYFILKDRITLEVATILTGEVVQCLNVPANTLVKNVHIIMVTPNTGTAYTATVGDGSGANSWGASVNLKAVAGTVTSGVPGTDAYATSGKVYSVADTIDLTVTINTVGAVAPVFDIIAECISLD